MIALSSITFDPDGHLVINDLPSTDYGETTRRVSRQKTLDGGVTITDGGYAVGDRTIRVRWRVESLAKYQEIERMVQTYPRLVASTRDGVFTVAPERLTVRNREGDLTLLVIS